MYCRRSNVLCAGRRRRKRRCMSRGRWTHSWCGLKRPVASSPNNTRSCTMRSSAKRSDNYGGKPLTLCIPILAIVAVLTFSSRNLYRLITSVYRHVCRSTSLPRSRIQIGGGGNGKSLKINVFFLQYTVFESNLTLVQRNTGKPFGSKPGLVSPRPPLFTFREIKPIRGFVIRL